MDQKLRWGGQIIQMLDQLDGHGHHVIIVRHSERPSFHNIPREQWDQVDLTDTGIEEARNFGRALVAHSNVKQLQVLGWGFKRCQTTALAICEGASQQSNRIHQPTKISLQSPIISGEKYRKALHSLTWDEFIGDWLNNATQNTGMTPAHKYAEETFLSLLREAHPGKTTVIATHDLFIIPLARYYFAGSSHNVDFLDGVVLQVRDDHLKVGYAGEIKTVPHPPTHPSSKTKSPLPSRRSSPRQ
jgi:broad specificity phosphatase PhoE